MKAWIIYFSGIKTLYITDNHIIACFHSLFVHRFICAIRHNIVRIKEDDIVTVNKLNTVVPGIPQSSVFFQIIEKIVIVLCIFLSNDTTDIRRSVINHDNLQTIDCLANHGFKTFLQILCDIVYRYDDTYFIFRWHSSPPHYFCFNSLLIIVEDMPSVLGR